MFETDEPVASESILIRSAWSLNQWHWFVTGIIFNCGYSLVDNIVVRDDNS